MAAPLGGSVSVGPIINSAGPGEPFFAPASGGGGGGGGPNLNVSTLNVYGSNGTIGMNYRSPGVTSQIVWNTNTSGSTFVNQAPYPTYPMAPTQVSSVNGEKISFINQNGQFEGLQVGGLVFDGNGQGSTARTPAMASDPAGNLNVWASNVNISSINVSSINGAAPGGGGGGGGPNLTVSTLTAAQTVSASTMSAYGFTANNISTLDQLTCQYGSAGDWNVTNTLNTSTLTVSTINGAPYTPGGGGGGPNLTASTITLSGPNPITANLSTTKDGFEVRYGGGSGNPISVLNIDKANPNQAEFGVRVLSTIDGSALARFEMTVVPSTDNTATLSHTTDHTVGSLVFSPAEDDLTISANSTITMTAAGGVGIPFLNNVSTLSGPGVYPRVSTINLSTGVQTVYNVSTSTAVPISDPFTIEIGHSYQISFNYAATPSAPAAYGQYVTFAATGVAVGGARSYNSDLSISTFNQGQLVLAGQGNGTCQITATANTATPVLIDFVYNTTNLELIDFGPIKTSF